MVFMELCRKSRKKKSASLQILEVRTLEYFGFLCDYDIETFDFLCTRDMRQELAKKDDA